MIKKKETTACMRSRRDNLSTDQALAASANLREVGGCYVPLLASWCAELLPEIADEEEVCTVTIHWVSNTVAVKKPFARAVFTTVLPEIGRERRKTEKATERDIEFRCDTDMDVLFLRDICF